MDNNGRRRPSLRSDTERTDARPRRRSPEIVTRGSDDQRITSSENERFQEESMKDIDGVLSMLMECSLDSVNLEANLKDTCDYFDNLISSKKKRLFLQSTFSMSLENYEFARIAGALYGVMHTIKIEDDTVRSFLLSTIQKELEDNDFRSGIRKRFLNAVFLLSEMYYHIRIDDKPISVLGGELLKYFRWLLTGEEKELETLATCIIVNGVDLKKDKPASYRKLLMEIRTTLVTRNLSPKSRSWLLLIIDMDNVNFVTLPDELLMCHMTMIGDEGFQKFKRVRPTIMPFPSNKVNNTKQVPLNKRVGYSKQFSNQSHERRTPERQVSYEDGLAPERCSSDDRNPGSLQPSDDWSPEEHGCSLKQYSDDWPSSDAQKTILRDTQKQSETHRSQRNPRVQNYTGRPIQGCTSKRNINLWTEPPSVPVCTKNNKKIPVWQHEHDDRFDRDYGN